ncbi:hypothetical protein K7432_007482 [Basidiobolus ranarum]|uniref:Yeast cell wall synthesis Kre9/Knh1-like N-terminal domain-containing protein n=1 Tax=Basidiobolus ranarum TaxID=34480 RepID=A0ABR2W016_9FUNG
MLFLSFFALCAWTSLVMGDIAITSPVEGTVWEPGKEIVITWTTIPGTNVNPDKLEIALMVGPATAMNVATIIKSGVDAKAGSFTWRVPNDLSPGKQYSVRAGDNGNVQYSHYFDVKGGASGNASTKSTNPKPTANRSASKASASTGMPTTTSSMTNPTAQASPSKSLSLISIAPQQPTKVGGATTSPINKLNSVAPREMAYPIFIVTMLMAILFAQ